MSSRRGRRLIVLLSAAVCAAVVATPAVGAAANAGHSTAAAKAHPSGFFVTGVGRVSTSNTVAAFLRDPQSGLHVVTTVRSLSAPGDQGHIVYKTRQAGTTHWVTHNVPGLRPMAGGIKVELHLSSDAKHVFAVFYECDGVFAAQASLTATRLPQPTLVQAGNTCTATGAVSAAGSPIQHAVGLPYSNEIGIVLPDPAAKDRPTVFIGQAGGTFTPSIPLPTTNSFSPQAIAFDPVTYELSVVGTGLDGDVRGIYVVSAPYWDEFVSLTRIATLNSATKDYSIQSIAAAGRGLWVGLLRPGGLAANPNHRIFLDHGTGLNGAGQWTGAFAVPHSTGHDSGLVLAVNPATNRPHAAFTRVYNNSKTKKSGIVLTNLSAKGWSKPKFFTHWYRDSVDQIAITASGASIISYDQR
jgi:hypothetical protein